MSVKAANTEHGSLPSSHAWGAGLTKLVHVSWDKRRHTSQNVGCLLVQRKQGECECPLSCCLGHRCTLPGDLQTSSAWRLTSKPTCAGSHPFALCSQQSSCVQSAQHIVSDRWLTMRSAELTYLLYMLFMGKGYQARMLDAAQGWSKVLL